jgi:hypothetical protein
MVTSVVEVTMPDVRPALLTDDGVVGDHPDKQARKLNAADIKIEGALLPSSSGF